MSTKWRSLTKSNVDRLSGNETSFSLDVTRYIASKLSALMTIAGCHEKYAYNAVTEDFGNKLELMVISLQELRKAIGEKITSCDMGVFGYNCGTTFDPVLMADNFNNGPKTDEIHSVGPVLCTIALGLKLSKRVTKDGKVEDVEEVLLLPKVVLQSAMDDIIGIEADRG